MDQTNTPSRPWYGKAVDFGNTVAKVIGVLFVVGSAICLLAAMFDAFKHLTPAG